MHESRAPRPLMLKAQRVLRHCTGSTSVPAETLERDGMGKLESTSSNQHEEMATIPTLYVTWKQQYSPNLLSFLKSDRV